MHAMSCATFVLIFFLTLSSGLAKAEDNAKVQDNGQAKDQTKVQANVRSMYMPDGQLIDRHMHVYVQGIDDRDLENATLLLIHPENNKKFKLVRYFTIPNQQYEKEVNGKKETASGTELIFRFNEDKANIPNIPWYEAAWEFLPILVDKEGMPITGSSGVYISHKNGTIFDAFLIIALIVIIINSLARTDRRLLGIWGLLRTADGRMSVSLTQAFLWTLAVGTSVLLQGISRLEVPDIPVSLWILMGMSVATGVAGHYQADSANQARISGGKTAKREPPSLKQLVMLKLPDGTDDPDLSKAQLLFWTVITLTIFIIKSYVAGNLWDVPTSLLVLMGISQTGYLSRQQTIIEIEKKTSQNGQAPKAEGAALASN